MEIKTIKYDFTKFIFMSMFFTMFCQIIDVLYNTHVSIIGILSFFIGIVYIKVKYKKFNFKIGLFLGFTFIESLLLIVNQISMINTLYPMLLNFIIFSYVYKYFDLHFYYKNINIIRYLLFIYMIINFVLYLSKNQLFIQYDGFSRFKGVLPHSNMLAGLLLGFLFLNSIKHDSIKLILDLLIIILMFITSSRIYIVACILSYFLLNYFRKEKVKNQKSKIYNILLLISILVIIIFFLYNKDSIYTYIINTNTYKRYFYLQTSSNGRNNLSYYFFYVFNNSDLLSKIFGGSMANSYFNLTHNTFSHSFSENSIIAITISFGLVGFLVYVSMFLLYIINLVRSKVRNKLTNIILILILLITTYFQDVILSTQLFAMYMIALSIVSNNNSTINKKTKKV